MKKQLLCGAAASAITLALGGVGVAADMPVKAPPMIAADWSGYYVGAHIGWAEPRFKGTWFGDTTFQDASQNRGGILGGLQGGRNWQQNTFVYGWEADVSFMSIKGTYNSVSDTPPVDQLSSKLSLLASLRGRLGMTFDRTTLLYFTAGPAFAHGTVEMFNDRGPVTISADYNKFGGVVGVGAEFLQRDHWSWRVEGLYYFFGNSDVTLVGPADIATSGLKDVFVARLALNRLFNSGP